MGPLAFGKKEGEVFLGRDMASTPDLLRADRPGDRRRGAAHRDRAVRAGEEGPARATATTLDKIADALLEYETLDVADVDVLLAGGAITRPPPPKSPPPPPPPPATRRRPRRAAPRRPGRADQGRAREGVGRVRRPAGTPSIRIGGRDFAPPGAFVIGVAERHARLLLRRRPLPRPGRRRGARAARWPSEGADLVDVGGESTRPGRRRRSPRRRSSRRVIPVLERLGAARASRSRSRSTPPRRRWPGRRSTPGPRS